MKKLLFSSIIIFVFSQSVIGQCVWQWSDPNTGGSHLEKCCFVDANTGFSVGWDGVIIKTTDSGLTWKQQYTGYNYFFYSVYFVNSNTGFVVSGDEEYPTNGIILKTTNGGSNWNKIITFNHIGLFDINFLNDQTGFVGGQYYWIKGVIYKTTNGGNEWTPANFQDTNTVVHSIKFINNTTGFAGAENGKILKTTDSGLNWLVSRPITDGEFTDISFIDNSVGYTVNSWGLIYKTTDCGSNWTLIYNNSQMEFQSISFLNTTTGIAIGGGSYTSNNGFILKTTNEGLTWDSISYGSNKNLRSVFGNINYLYTVGYWGGVFKSTNAGNNWVNLNNGNTNSNYNKIKFFDESIGIVVGDNGLIRNTTNSGLDWFNQNSNTTKDIEDIEIIDNNTAWIAGKSGFLSKTSNKGTNWNTFNLGTGYDLNTIKFFANIGYIICSYYFPNQPSTSGKMYKTTSSKIYKTTDYGNSWNIVYSSNFSFSSGYFINESTGFYIQYPSPVYKTTDGALTWNQIDAPISIINSISFINNSTGFISGRNLILKTTNSGLNWITKNINVGYQININQISFINSLTGYAACLSFPEYGRAGDLLSTTDCGDTWIHLTSESPLPTIQRRAFTSIIFLNENLGFATGERGTLLKTTNAGSVFVSQISTKLPDNFYLHQNYPNPFNPSTKINYDLRNAGFVTLKVFDILGKEVASLVNERQTVGSYRVEFDGSNLSSGIYFYTLSADEFKETKKMLLVK